MDKDEIVATFLAHGDRLCLAAEAGIARSRLPDLVMFRAQVQTDLDGFLRTLDAPFETRRLALPPSALARLAVLEATPDLFGPLDHVRAETLHTRVLAWALSPSRVGSLGTAPLRAFLAILASRPDSEVRPEWADNAEHVRAEPERSIAGRGRIDVWLRLPDAIFAIEAKVDHVERPGQLADYRRAVEAAPGPGKRFTVFLTLRPEPMASDPAALHITFQELFAAWLPVAAAARSGEHQYLGAWLRTVAQGLVQISGVGPFSTWHRAQRGRTLSLLEETT